MRILLVGSLKARLALRLLPRSAIFLASGQSGVVVYVRASRYTSWINMPKVLVAAKSWRASLNLKFRFATRPL
jgi:hypothetical protein